MRVGCERMGDEGQEEIGLLRARMGLDRRCGAREVSESPGSREPHTADPWGPSRARRHCLLGLGVPSWALLHPGREGLRRVCVSGAD